MSHIQDAIREWVWIVGQDRPDVQWLLSDYDSWERNPHYNGPEQRHPEDYEYDEPVDMTDVEADANTLANVGWGTDEDYVCDNDYFDDIPF
jgi:hypothetical protein